MSAASCKVEVRANELNSVLGYSHLFIVFTDAAGEEFYLRGGPSAQGPGGSGQLSSELSGGSSKSGSAGSSDASTSGHSGSGSNASASGGNGPYGAIQTQYGPYEPGTIDYDPGAKSIEVASGSGACSKYAELKAQMDLIAASNTRYNPLGPNSNSTVFTALRNVGIKPKVPDGVWAPGARTHIKTPKATSSTAKVGSPSAACPSGSSSK